MTALSEIKINGIMQSTRCQQLTRIALFNLHMLQRCSRNYSSNACDVETRSLYNKHVASIVLADSHVTERVGLLKTD